MKKFKNFLFLALLGLLAVLTGGMGGVIMATGTELPDAGAQAAKTEGGTGDGAPQHLEESSSGSGVYQNKGEGDPRGMGSITAGEEVAAELYEAEIDKRITKIRPMATPLVQIASYARKIKSDSMEVRYWSVGTRPIKTTISSDYSAKAASVVGSVELPVTDPTMFDTDDTIRVVGVHGYKEDGATASSDDLVLCVTGLAQSGNPMVFAVNGLAVTGGTTKVPSLTAGTVLVRMGKACAELDAQTSSFANYPEPEVQYCQNYMAQVEQSTFDKLADKEVNWNFSDMEEDSLYDFKLGKEASSLFGVKRKVKHPVKRNNVWFTQGLWSMPSRDITVGTWNKEKGAICVTDDEFVDIDKYLFTGVDCGGRRKVALAGSDVIAAFSKTTSDKYMVKTPGKFWDMEFDGFKANFGELDFIHNEFFDLMGMADCALVIDPELLTQATYISMGRTVLDLKKLGVRNSEAVVMQEVSCLYLRCAKAHARMRLAEKPDAALNFVVTSGNPAAIAADSTATIAVKVDSVYAWEASQAVADTWYTINQIGDNLYIIPTANASTTDARTGTITLTSAGKGQTVTKTISLSQAKAEA